MGSVLKFIKGLGRAFINMPTSTKLKMASGLAVLIGGVAIASGAMQDTDVEPLLMDGKDIALPEADNIDASEVVEAEAEIIED